MYQLCWIPAHLDFVIVEFSLLQPLDGLSQIQTQKTVLVPCMWPENRSNIICNNKTNFKISCYKCSFCIWCLLSCQPCIFKVNCVNTMYKLCYMFSWNTLPMSSQYNLQVYKLLMYLWKYRKYSLEEKGYLVLNCVNCQRKY